MNAEHTRHLLESYPKLYVQHDRPPTETAMCFLFDCGDGWFDIIDLLSKQLEWLNDTGAIRVEAIQVKEKYGTLRFYTCEYDTGSDCPEGIVWALTDYAEARSAYVCEECGAYGKRREGSWIRTLCDKCEDKSHAPD